MSDIMPQIGKGASKGWPIADQTIDEFLNCFTAHYANVDRLCDDLEAIADSLPDKVNPQDCLAAARRVTQVVKHAHEFEETSLWPTLRALRPDDRRLAASLERLRYEHWEDESYAEELESVLMDWAMCVGKRSAEMTGYMLRGFFEGMRRHVAFEREHVVPLLQETLELKK